MRAIEKFICDKCGSEYYESSLALKCEFEHEMGLVYGSYLTHTAKVADSKNEALNHVVDCDWCKNYIKVNILIEERDLALQRARYLANIFKINRAC